MPKTYAFSSLRDAQDVIRDIRDKKNIGRPGGRVHVPEQVPKICRVYAGLVTENITKATSTALGVGKVKLIKRDVPNTPDFIELEQAAGTVEEPETEPIEKDVFSINESAIYGVGEKVVVGQDMFGSFLVLSAGGTNIVTLKLNGDLLSGSTIAATLCDDSGTSLGVDPVVVTDSPTFIPAGKKLEANLYIRCYLGDDGVYRMLATQSCAVDDAAPLRRMQAKAPVHSSDPSSTSPKEDRPRFKRFFTSLFTSLGLI